MEWLVARHAAAAIGAGDQRPEVLGARPMSPLMADFFRGLLGRDAARDWANGVLAAPSSADIVKANALLVLDRLGEKPLADSQLAGQDLRGASLSGRDFYRADLHDADLSDARLDGANLAVANLSGAKLRKANLNEAILVGADLTGADLTGARLLGADLRETRLAGSGWRRAALIGAVLEESAFAALDTLGAALPGTDAEPQFSLWFGGMSLAFNPDGGLLAVASNGGAVWILDAATREPLRALRSDAGRIQAVAFDTTGTWLASASDDSTVRLWDPTNGQQLHTLQGHPGSIWGVAFSPDGHQLASASNDGTIRLWDPRQGTWLATLVPLTEGWAVVTPDGRYKLEGVAGASSGGLPGCAGSNPASSTPTSPRSAACRRTPLCSRPPPEGRPKGYRPGGGAGGGEVSAAGGRAASPSRGLWGRGRPPARDGRPAEVSSWTRLLWNSVTHSEVSCCISTAASSAKARSRPTRVRTCLPSTVRVAALAHSTAQSYWSSSSRRRSACAVVMVRIQPDDRPKKRSNPTQAAASASST